ncbi:MAG TPA: hypothetical protein ENJ56_03070, partial [Anaerolineae bacterium]|nr:hypothetical protein [Anaerolineae bacterium]
EKLATLSTNTAVKTIYPDQTYQLQLDASLDQIAAPAAWQQLGGSSQAGRGIKVAIIDTGIEPNHPFFNGTGYTMPSGYPKGDCVVGGTTFCNGKIIAARWYGENGGVPAAAIAQEVASPLDRTGHGSHVAGIAVGNAGQLADSGDGVPETVSGTAPAAYLMVYKACWNGADCLTSGLLAALDDAVADGADVVNNSWGGSPGDDPANSPFRTAIENAVLAGVPMIFSAGNEGDAAETITCPACVAETIAVANLSTNRLHASKIDLYQAGTTDIQTSRAALPSEEAVLNATIFNRGVIYAGADNANNGTLCAPMGGTFLGNPIIIAYRGGCSFATKVDNAVAAQAGALLLINNRAGQPSRFSVGASNQIPTLMFDQIDGQHMLDRILAQSNPKLTINLLSRQTNPAWDNILAVSSSRGPNGDANSFKPDLAAPGHTILSASTYGFGGTGWAFDSGTSMAAPHVAGVAALLLQKHPAWSAAQIKSALLGSANRADLFKLENNSLQATNFFDTGAGQVDALQTLNTAATFDSAAYSNPACLLRCTWQNQLRNETNQTLIWDATVETVNGLALTVAPSSMTLAAGASANFAVNVEVVGAPFDEWRFVSVTWTARNQATLPSAFLPMTILPRQATEGAVFVKSAET